MEVEALMVTRTRYGAGSVVMAIFGVIALIILLGVFLVLVRANPNNMLVDLILDIGRFFARPFRSLVQQDTAREEILVNWTIAALAYLLVGAIISSIVRRV
jgi:hypothetical protein